MADTIIENLITQLSFDFDQKTLDQFNAGVEKAAKSLTKIVAVAAAAATGIFFFTKRIAESNDELGKFAQRIGVDIKEIQKLGFAAELNGGSIDSMNNSLEGLTASISAAARGIGVDAFGILGLSVTKANGELKRADELIFEIADSVSKLKTQQERLELAGAVGISPDLLLTIQQGSEALKKQAEEAEQLDFIIGGKEAAQAAAFLNDQLLKVRKIIKGVTNVIGRGLMKEIAPLLKAFVEWFKLNRKLIKQNIVVFLEKISKGFKILLNLGVRVASVVMGVSKALGGLENTLLAVGTAFLLMNAKALLLPAVLGAALAILFLLTEDLQKFVEGGDSAFAKFNDWLDEWEGETKGTRNNFWRNVFADPDKYFKEAIETWKNDWRVWLFDWENFFLHTIIRITRFFEMAWENSLDFVKNKFKAFFEFITPSLSRAEKAIQDINRENRPGTSVPLPELGATALPKFDLPVSSSQTTTSRTENIDNRKIEIAINGGDLNEVRRVVDETLNNKFSAAKKNLTSSVAY